MFIFRASIILGRTAKLTEGPRNFFLRCMRLFTYSYWFEIKFGKDMLFSQILDRFSSKYRFPEYDLKLVTVFYSRENFDE